MYKPLLLLHEDLPFHMQRLETLTDTVNQINPLNLITPFHFNIRSLWVGAYIIFFKNNSHIMNNRSIYYTNKSKN